MDETQAELDSFQAAMDTVVIRELPTQVGMDSLYLKRVIGRLGAVRGLILGAVAEKQHIPETFKILSNARIKGLLQGGSSLKKALTKKLLEP